jgi:glycosyltransferase involved in cell wall biosynthesis
VELLDPDLVVLLKTWQGPTQEIALQRLDALGPTIGSLERHANCPFRWCIVDDGSNEWYTDAVKEAMGERHHVFISSWADGDIGFSLNEGLRVAFGQSDVVLNWSDDVVLRQAIDVAAYVKLLREDERLGYVTLRPTHPTLNLTPLEVDGHLLHEVSLDSPGKFLIGTSLNLMHRRAWRVYGPWPEGLRIDIAQEEMAWRMRRFGDGPKIVIPNELVDAQGCVTYGTHSTWDWRLKDEQEKKAWYRYRNYAARFEHG